MCLVRICCLVRFAARVLRWAIVHKVDFIVCVHAQGSSEFAELRELLDGLPEEIAGLIGTGTQLFFDYGGSHAAYIRTLEQNPQKKPRPNRKSKAKSKDQGKDQSKDQGKDQSKDQGKAVDGGGEDDEEGEVREHLLVPNGVNQSSMLALLSDSNYDPAMFGHMAI